jgi:hypothetical protein
LQHKLLPDTFVVTGFDGDIRTLPHSVITYHYQASFSTQYQPSVPHQAVNFWEQTCLEPFKPTADMLYLVIPPPDTRSIDRKVALLPFFQALGGMYEVRFRPCLLYPVVSFA